MQKSRFHGALKRFTAFHPMTVIFWIFFMVVSFLSFSLRFSYFGFRFPGFVLLKPLDPDDFRTISPSLLFADSPPKKGGCKKTFFQEILLKDFPDEESIREKAKRNLNNRTRCGRIYGWVKATARRNRPHTAGNRAGSYGLTDRPGFSKMPDRMNRGTQSGQEQQTEDGQR